MNVEHAPFEAVREDGRQNAHEAREHHEVGLVGGDEVAQGLVELFARGEGLVIKRHGFDAVIAGRDEALGFGTVRNHGADIGADRFGPAFRAGALENRLEIAAAAGNQNDDVFHG